jgi:hypothetical protein
MCQYRFGSFKFATISFNRKERIEHKENASYLCELCVLCG